MLHMQAERTADVVNPAAFPQCANCEFAARAAQAGLLRFPKATSITLVCKLSGGGGATRASPDGTFIEFQGRTITVIPDIIDKHNKYEYLEGAITTCPVDIADSPQRHVSEPYLEHVGADKWERVFRYRVPVVASK